MSSKDIMPSYPRYVLPADLKAALHALAETDLLRLSASVTAELKQRGLHDLAPQRSRTQPLARTTAPRTMAPPLPPARVSAIHAAITAGVKLSVIARQFGVSLQVVRSAVKEQLARPR
jgi:hypothetical protein